MGIGNKDTRLSTQETRFNRTDFTSKKGRFFGPGFNDSEREVIEFIEANKGEVLAFLNNKCYKFFDEWMKRNEDYYKDVLSDNTKNELDAKLRGIISGHKEIIAMFKYIEKHIGGNKNG